MPADEMRGFSLDLRGHLELGPAEFLDLELMRVLVAGNCTIRLQIYSGVTKIRVVRQFEFEVERTESIKIAHALRDLIIARVLDRPGYAGGRVAERLDVAELAARHLSDVALDRHLFVRLVHFAVVENEPAEQIEIRFFVPVRVVLPIVFGVFRQKCSIVSATSYQQAHSV